MGMKFSSIVDRHEKKPNESKYQRKRKKIAKRLEFSRRSFYTKQSIYFVEKKKKKKRRNIPGSRSILSPSQLERHGGKNWLAFLYGAVETINTSRLIIG